MKIAGRCSAKSQASRARTEQRWLMARGMDSPPRANDRSVVMFDLKTFQRRPIPQRKPPTRFLLRRASTSSFHMNGTRILDGNFLIRGGRDPDQEKFRSGQAGIRAQPATAGYMRSSPTPARWLRSTRRKQRNAAHGHGPCKQPRRHGHRHAHHRLFSGCRAELLQSPTMRRQGGGHGFPSRRCRRRGFERLERRICLECRRPRSP